MVSLEASQDIGHFIENLRATDHVILFYDNLEDKNNVLFKFFSDGLAHGKGIVYVYSEETLENIRNRMISFDINLLEAEKQQKLVIRRFDEWYIVNGQVEVLRILSLWKDAFEEFRKRGFGLRIAGDMACFFKHKKVRELLRYEYSFTKKVIEIPVEAICAYNVNTIVETGYSETIMPLIRAHGWAIFTGPRGIMLYKPENIGKDDIEELLKIKI